MGEVRLYVTERPVGSASILPQAVASFCAVWAANSTDPSDAAAVMMLTSAETGGLFRRTLIFQSLHQADSFLRFWRAELADLQARPLTQDMNLLAQHA